MFLLRVRSPGLVKPNTVLQTKPMWSHTLMRAQTESIQWPAPLALMSRHSECRAANPTTPATSQVCPQIRGKTDPQFSSSFYRLSQQIYAGKSPVSFCQVRNPSWRTTANHPLSVHPKIIVLQKEMKNPGKIEVAQWQTASPCHSTPLEFTHLRPPLHWL